MDENVGWQHLERLHRSLWSQQGHQSSIILRAKNAVGIEAAEAQATHCENRPFVLRLTSRLELVPRRLGFLFPTIGT